jgi:urease gamma subunit
MLANLEDRVRAAMERPVPERPGRPGQQVIAELARALVSVVAEATGLTPQQVVEQIQGGATLAEIVEANGGDVEAIMAWMVSERAARLNRAVATGHLSREEADQRLADYRERVVAAMDGELPFEPRRPTDVLGLNLVNAVAEATGLTPQAVLAQARAGKTLAEIAQENGADVDSIVAQVVAEATANLEDRVREAVNSLLPTAGAGQPGEEAPGG